ncbi:MAG: alpha-2-macroglobulin family protein [Myxococcota bacterium]
MRSPWLALALAGCGMAAPMGARDELAPPPPPAAPPGFGLDGRASAERAEAGGGFGMKDAENDAAPRVALLEPVAASAAPVDAAPEEAAPAKKGAAADEPARTRSWFPEAFLWQPLVETGQGGAATVEFTVPDALTTWRVLGLAHDAQGHQAGAVYTFDGTLPLYVDPVVPGWVFAGDRISLPVQVVSTRASPVSATLEVRAEGAMTGLGVATVSLASAGTDVRTMSFDVIGAGAAKITASLSAGEDSDAAERTVTARPAGRPVETGRGGTLSAERTIRLAGPSGADPTTEEIEVVVFPGPLAVVGAELDRLAAGARPDDAAYAYALSGAVASLSATAGVPVDAAAVRRLRLLAWQRVVYAARAPDAGAASDLVASLRGSDDDPQVHELLPRQVRLVVDGQRADGTWSRTATGSLQGVVVQTAWAARALPEGERGARLRASGAIERHARTVNDPYTAAVVVASGLAEGLTEGLVKQITDAVVTDPDTGADLPVPAGVVNPWGQTPTSSEVLAWAVLALPADHPARGDLASRLLQRWSGEAGFGAGRADVIALEALVAALPGSAAPVQVSLALDGVVVATASVDPSQPKVPVHLSGAPTAAGPVELTLTSSAPGLAFVATRRSWVPWSDQDRVAGVDLEVTVGDLRAGREGTLNLRAAAPSGAVVRISQGLPAGAFVDPSARAAAAEVGATLEVLTDRVIVTTRPFEAGEILELAVPVTPAFAGRFQTGPTEIQVDGAAPVPVRPAVWNVGGT